MSRALYLHQSIRKDTKRMLRDPLGMLTWLLIPIMVGTLLQLAFGGQEGTPIARLLVADEDNSLVSGLITGALGQDQLGELIDSEAVEPEEGRALIERGKATALLVIPEGFGDAFLEGEPDTLHLFTNPAQTILPGIVQEVLEIMTAGGSVLREFLDVPISQILELDELTPDAGPSDEAVADISVQVNQMITGADQYLFPPAISYERVVPDTTEEVSTWESGLGSSLIGLFFPGLLTMVLLFSGASASADVWEERRNTTLRRAISTPTHLRWFVLGKMVAGSQVLGLILLVGIVTGRFIFGIPMQYWFAGVLLYALAGAAWIAVLTGLQVLSTRERGASILINLIVMVLMLAGGSFFPIQAMPEFLQPVARLTPNGWTITRFNELASGSITPLDLLPVAGILVAIFLVGWLFATWRMAGGWGRGTD